jgi:uncharacterized protein (TIGR02145 family)
LAFTLSCSGGDDNDGGGGGGNAQDGCSNVAVSNNTMTCGGKTYRTVEIGGKKWMAENLNYAVDESVCYDDLESNCDQYGRLYNWATAMGICPIGWHLPSDDDWKALMTAVGGSATAGTKLKADNDLWNGDGRGTDDFGFSALPGGYGTSGGSFYYVSNVSLWWSSTENDASTAYGRYMDDNNANVLRNYGDKGNLCSVRCVKD